MFRLAFTTLAAPSWSWEETLDRAVEYEYEGVELRGVEGEMDLPRARPFVAAQLEVTKKELAGHGLTVPCLGTSCRLHEEEVEKNLDEARRNIDLAAELGAPYIRVFGDRLPQDETRDRVVDRIVDGLMTLGEYAQGAGVQVLIESHGDFSRTDDLVEVIHRASHPRVQVLWDVHHPYRFHGEPVAETYGKLHDRIRHVHLKDSSPTGDGPRYCLVGEGDTPIEESLQLLQSGGYGGWIAYEWEKKWHPEIEEPEVALPAFTRTIRKMEVELAEREGRPA